MTIRSASHSWNSVSVVILGNVLLSVFFSENELHNLEVLSGDGNSSFVFNHVFLSSFEEFFSLRV